MRPDGWDIMDYCSVAEQGESPLLAAHFFEAGADAIYQYAYDKGRADLLEGLKADCQKHFKSPDEFEWVLIDTDGKSGCVIFIPEE